MCNNRLRHCNVDENTAHSMVPWTTEIPPAGMERLRLYNAHPLFRHFHLLGSVCLPGAVESRVPVLEPQSLESVGPVHRWRTDLCHRRSRCVLQAALLLPVQQFHWNANGKNLRRRFACASGTTIGLRGGVMRASPGDTNYSIIEGVTPTRLVQ